MIRERDVSILCLIGAILIFAAVWQCALPKRPEPVPATPVLVIVDSPTPSVVVTAGSAVPHATQTTTVYTDRLPTRTMLPTATPMSTPEPTVAPTETPTPEGTRVRVEKG